MGNLMRAVGSATLVGALVLAACADDKTGGDAPGTGSDQAFDLQSCMDAAETADAEDACESTEAEIKLAVRRECMDQLSDNDAWEDCNAEVRADPERWSSEP